jgi:hypothetical protein
VLQSPDPAVDARAALQDPDLERPALEYPNLQSSGAAVISFASPDRPAVAGGLSCLWEPGGAYSDPRVVALQRFSIVLAGEQVEIWLGPQNPLGDALDFAIHRHGAASYVSGPGTGSVERVGIANDRSSGTLRFGGLAPSPETAPPLTTSPAEWIGPLGGDAAMAKLTGTAAWACEPPPANLSEVPYSCVLPAGPLCLGDPDPIVLVVDDQRQVGTDLCGGLSGDTCGPRPYALSADYVVAVRTGHILRFELPDEGSHFVRWSLGWAAQSDAERCHSVMYSDEPCMEEPWDLIDKGVLSEGSALEFDAPPPGEWSGELGWTDDRFGEGGSVARIFRVVVQ